MIGDASPWLAFTVWLLIAMAAVLVVRLYCSVRAAEQQRGNQLDDLARRLKDIETDLYGTEHEEDQ